MSDPSDAASLLRALSRGLDERDTLAPGPARDGLDATLLDAIGRLRASLQETLLDEPGGPAPRSITAAYACAMFSQPLLSVLFGTPEVRSTGRLPVQALHEADAPVVLAPEALKEVFRLRDWELDDLREEVDRRVGHLLKQDRALQWLWDRFGLPGAGVETLFRALFPAAPATLGQVAFVRAGAQLYAVLDVKPAPPLASLYLPWEARPESGWVPIGSFDARSVDEGLRSVLGRAIGASDDEVVSLLDAMVTVIPASNHQAFIAHDAWRIRGLATMTTLGGSHRDGAWLSRRLAPADIEVAAWLVPERGGLRTTDAVAAFDRLAMNRVAAMMRHLYAELLARLYRERPTDPASPAPEDIDIYHVKRHIQRVLQPLLDWATADATARYIAGKLRLREEVAREGLQVVARAWLERADRFWWGAPSKAQRHTVRGALALHLLCTHDTLRQAHRRPDRWVYPFRDLLLLFAAHWFAEGGLVADVVQGDQEAWQNDPVTRWFWGVWSDVVDTIDTDVHTWSGPHPIR